MLLLYASFLLFARFSLSHAESKTCRLSAELECNCFSDGQFTNTKCPYNVCFLFETITTEVNPCEPDIAPVLCCNDCAHQVIECMQSSTDPAPFPNIPQILNHSEIYSLSIRNRFYVVKIYLMESELSLFSNRIFKIDPFVSENLTMLTSLDLSNQIVEDWPDF